MQLKSLTLLGPAIKFSAVYNPKSDDEHVAEEERTSTCKQAALPELATAFSKLPPVVCRIFGWQPDYVDGMTVYHISVGRTKLGTRRVGFKFKKALETIGGNPFDMECPEVKIEEPKDGESGTMNVSDEDAEVIEEVIDQCERYVNGERAQGEIDFEKAKAGLNALADKGRDAMADQPSFDLPLSPQNAAKKTAKKAAKKTAKEKANA